MSSRQNVLNPIEEDRARSDATRVLDRWRSQGFDTLLCYPSGYCSPSNARIVRGRLPDAYRIHPIDSEQALAKLAESIRAGHTYRL